MNYTLNQLRIFIKIVEKQSVTKAAEELHLTQPAVSIQLKNFQEQFDIPLIEHIGRKIFITDFGKEIAFSCERILSEVNEIENKKMAHHGHLTGKLKISVVSTGKYVMPYFLSDFVRSNPGIELSMDVTNKGRVIENLEENLIDFALVSVLPKGLMVDAIPLMKNKLYLVGPANDSQLGNLKKPKNLENVPLIFRENGSATRQAMEQYISANNIVTKKRMELTSNEAVKQAVMAGLGFSIMPYIGIRNEVLNEELSIVKMKNLPIETNWNLVFLKNKGFSPVAAAFLTFIQEQKEKIIESNFSGYELI